MNSPRGLSVVASLVALAVIAAVVVAGVVLSSRPAVAPSPGEAGSGSAGNTNQAECTLEAKLCPDGSFVGRVLPGCEFAACPMNTNTTAVQRNAECLSTCKETQPCQIGVETAEILADGACSCSCKETVQPPTSISPTADWKTYTNTVLGYSIKYPNDWTVTETEGRISFSDPSPENGPFSTPIVDVEAKDDLFPQDLCLTKQTMVSVGGVDRVRQIEGCSYAGSEVATFFQKDVGYLVVSWTEDVPDAYTTYEQILSTFTFTE